MKLIMVDVATKEKPTQTKKTKTFSHKKFEIVLHLAKNEPFLTLEYLHSFVGSLANTFQRGSEKVHNPSPSVLKIIAGNETIPHRSIKFAIDGLKEEDVDIPGRGGQYIRNTLYPEDIIEIIFSSRAWLASKYKDDAKEYSWTIEASTLENYWIQAKKRRGEDGLTSHSIAEFSRRYLQESVEELFIKIEEILKKETKNIEYDSIDSIISDLEKEFAREPERTWEKIGLALTRALAESSINTPTVSIPNKNFKASDVRLAINTIYDEIVEQIEKHSGPEKPWDRVSTTTKGRFTSRRAPYFLTNELQQVNVNISDTIRADAFIKWIDELLDELEKEPEKTEATTEETEEEDEVGGGDDEAAKQQGRSLTQKEIIKEATNALEREATEAFIASFLDSGTDQNQKDWLITRLPKQIQDLLDQASIWKAVSAEISTWISDNLTLEKEEGDRFIISDDQFKELHVLLTKLVFTKYRDEFLKWITTVPSIEELKETKSTKLDTPTAEAVVPGSSGDSAEITLEKEKAINREKFISNTTTSFTNLYFGEESKYFRDVVYGLIAKELPGDLTTTDLLHLKLKIYNRLKLDKELFDFSKKHYENKLNALRLNDTLHKVNIDNALDSILVLIDDPHEYITNLSETELIKKFGLEGSDVHVEELRKLLIGLIFVRRAHYYINSSTPVIPWLKKDQADGADQRFGDLRRFVKKHGEDGVTALNLDGAGIEKLSIDEERKKKIKNLYRDLWISAVAGKTPDELIDIYLFYGVNPIDIDYMAQPVPDGFIYSDMAQAANNENPTAIQAKKAEISKKIFSKIGKAGLSLIPEMGPILAALEGVPIVGDMAKDAEEKAGKIIVEFGAILGGGVATILGLLSRSVGAMIGGISFGILGGALGSLLGPWGTAAGAIAGTGIGAGIGHSIGQKGLGNWFKGLGGSGSGSGIGGGAGGAFKMASPAMPTALVPATFGGIAAGTTFISVVASGSQLHPTGKPDVIVGEVNQSQYVEVVKEALPNQIENNQLETISYTITITPKENYIISVNLDQTKDEWSYLGGDPLNLEDMTEDILEQIGDEPLTQETTITYDVEMNGVDVAVSNTFNLVFDVIDESGGVVASDDLSAFATVMIGEPEIGCLVPAPGGDDWSGTQVLPWPAAAWARVMGALGNRAGTSTMFLKNVCNGGNPLEVNYLKGGFAEHYGGWAPSSFGGAKLGLYEYGLSFTDASLEYTLVHELGHIIDYRNGSLRSQFLTIPGGSDNCYDYPFPSMCSGGEAFAESIALYVTNYKNFDLKGRYPNQHEWLKTNIFGGVEF
jgi:hypothetical protein